MTELQWCLYLPSPLLTKEGEFSVGVDVGENLERNENEGIVFGNGMNGNWLGSLDIF